MTNMGPSPTAVSLKKSITFGNDMHKIYMDTLPTNTAI